MKNNATYTVRSEEITIDVRICAALAANRGGEVYLAAIAIVYNDDGKLMGLPLNRALWDEDGLMYDVIAGTFLVVGLGEEDFVSLSPELAQKYEEEFHQPEAFLPLGRRLMVIPVPDESVQNDAEKAVNKPPVEHDR